MKNLLLTTLLLHVTCSTVYRIIPDDENSPCSNTTRTFTLQHYFNSTKGYYKSHTELQFKQGHHYLCKDWMLKNISHFTINGNNSTLSCIKPSSIAIAIVNVTNITIKNLHIKQCSKTRDYTINKMNQGRHILILRKSTIFINYSVDVAIINTYIKVSSHYTSGIIGINIFTTNFSKSYLTNITVEVRWENNTNNLVSGIMLYYKDNNEKFNTVTLQTVVVIQQYIYKTHGLCNDSFALRLFMMNKEYNVTIQVKKSNFTDLLNSGVLSYYAESCRNAHRRSTLVFSDCKINNNKGNGFTSMFLMEINSHSSIFDIVKPNHLCSKLANNILFINCDFANNSKMNSLINILLKHNEQLNMLVKISKCKIFFNNDLQFINTDSELKLLKALSYTIIIDATSISSNLCANKNRLSLITLTSGIIKLRNSIITNNGNFENIIKLHSSLLQFEGFTNFSSNYARFILQGAEGSYYVHREYSRVYINNNFVYTMSTTSLTYTKDSKEICTNQFITRRKNSLDQTFKNGVRLNFTVIQENNIYAIPKYDINFLMNETYAADCVWLASTAFQTAKSTDVLNSVFSIERKYANKSDIGKIPSSVCPCSSKDDYNCSKHEIGSIFSGQILTVKLIMPEIGNTKSEKRYTTMMAQQYNSSTLGCHIINAYEISQTHPSHECNKYNYTIWYNGNSSECELYLGIEEVPEIFYVNLLPCPIGFSLQESKRACYCDQVLNNKVIQITLCNLEDGTILRPANSWISGRVVNDSNTYMVCTSCPFDYCLPHSLHINLSKPDLQCQFGRTGLLCGHCPKDLSTVFGSPHCEICSNVTLFVIIPIALAGILLVLMLFMLNLTVTNGAINTFIFYFNIVSINITMFIPMCHDSFACITLSLFNLDFGIKCCFYDGMDDYAKTWLQLVFPVYLIFIALILIMGSRHSKLIQRLTARRGLPVLATLFLLSYTKILLMVCHAVFFYSTVTYLPSKHSMLVWSVDTSVPLFGIKFSILFATCLVLFLILIPFNILLLFTRTLMRFKLISYFKPLLDAYFGPYKDKYYYWTGLQLLLRAVFFGLSSLGNAVNLTSGAILLGILLFVQGIVHPFKSQIKNVQESVLLLNLLALYVTALYNDGNIKQNVPIAWYIIFPILAYLIIFVCYHCIMSICGDKVKQKGHYIASIMKSKVLTSKVSREPILMENARNDMPDVTLNYEDFQESLIALSD